MGEVSNLQILARQRIIARVAGGRRTVGVGFEEGVADIIPFELGGNNKLGRAAEADVRVQIVILVTGQDQLFEEIGRASCRERVRRYGKISGVAGSLKKKMT